MKRDNYVIVSPDMRLSASLIKTLKNSKPLVLTAVNCRVVVLILLDF